jgi:hypothetical protein
MAGLLARRAAATCVSGAESLGAGTAISDQIRGRASLGAGGAALAAWPRTTVSAPPAKSDAEMLRFALTVERSGRRS